MMKTTASFKRVTWAIIMTGFLLSASSCAVHSRYHRRNEGERIYNQLNNSSPPVRSYVSVQDKGMNDALNKIPIPKQGHYNRQSERRKDSGHNNNKNGDGSFLSVLLGGLISFFLGGD